MVDGYATLVAVLDADLTQEWGSGQGISRFFHFSDGAVSRQGENADAPARVVQRHLLQAVERSVRGSCRLACGGGIGGRHPRRPPGRLAARFLELVDRE